MSYAVGEHFDKFIRSQVDAGHYKNADEVVREGLRLFEEREVKLRALKEHVAQALEQGGSLSDADVGAALAADIASRQKES
jgi:antitoxin ParD1/3/4